MIPTEEQQAIFDFAKAGKGNLIVEALAGSGKTSTALECLRYIPQRSVLFCAFNKRIADELVSRMPKPPAGAVYHAKTFHAAGLAIIKGMKAWPRLDVDPSATERLINEAAADLKEKYGLSVGFPVRRAAVKLLRTCKETCTDVDIEQMKVIEVGHNFDHFAKLTPDDIDGCARIVARAYAMGLDVRERKAIDFCDMTWLPIVRDCAPPSRYQAVIVDEAQDLSLPQLQLVKRLIAPNGRIFAIGDRSQQIYSWRGAIGDLVWKELRDDFKAQSLPLTTTWRCAKSIVKSANELVPALRARADAPAGAITSIQFSKLTSSLRAFPENDDGSEKSTFVLSRTNADLLQAALFLWREQISFVLAAGKEIVEPLYAIIDQLDKSSKERFRRNLMVWYQAEFAKAEAAHAAAWADRVEQQFAMLSMMLGVAEPQQFKKLLADIMVNDDAQVILSTVHKAKGLEADRVYLLKQTFARHKPREPWMTDPISQEELNIEYVGITRARFELIWVDLPDGADLVSKIIHQATLKAEDYQSNVPAVKP